MRKGGGTRGKKMESIATEGKEKEANGRNKKIMGKKWERREEMDKEKL